ncbi:FecR domain-containing protein [Steroidobacter cummioxidans]|uniref:FecR domain-containing protein n=1 Tax=Steroidobacter cummioxidans TaxID=1803913 RepID=UPI00137B81EB|nr:FecR domain-containing protein [Steroidobacter cummioxidans]
MNRLIQKLAKALRYVVQTFVLATIGVVWYLAATRVMDAEPEPVVEIQEIKLDDVRNGDIASADNEIRNERLSDGSLVATSPGTRMQVDLAGPNRLVVMPRGTAHFIVKKDAKPFKVQTPLVDVTVLGTSFSVSAGACSVVKVDEGVVRVDVRSGHGDPFTRILGADESLDWPTNCSGSRRLAEASPKLENQTPPPPGNDPTDTVRHGAL